MLSAAASCIARPYTAAYVLTRRKMPSPLRMLSGWRPASDAAGGTAGGTGDAVRSKRQGGGRHTANASRARTARAAVPHPDQRVHHGHTRVGSVCCVLDDGAGIGHPHATRVRRGRPSAAGDTPYAGRCSPPPATAAPSPLLPARRPVPPPVCALAPSKRMLNRPAP